MKLLFNEMIEAIRIALEQVNEHRMRSLLTALGVIIGIIAVTLMGTAIKGIDIGFSNSLDMLGTDSFYVEKWPWRDVGDDWMKYRNRPNLEAKYAGELNEIIQSTPDSSLVIAVPNRYGVVRRIERGDREISGVWIRWEPTRTYAMVDNADVEFGRFLHRCGSRGRSKCRGDWLRCGGGAFPRGPRTGNGESTVRIRKDQIHGCRRLRQTGKFFRACRVLTVM